MNKEKILGKIRDPKLRHNEVIEQTNPIFCMAPFSHIHLGPGDMATTCCKSRTPLGHTSQNTIEEIYNSDLAKDIRRAMLAGEKHWQCKGCYEYETKSSNVAENRQASNSQAMEEFNEFVKDNVFADGTLREPKPGYIDLLWTNKCNFSCLGCSPELSTTINNVYKKEFAILNGHGDNIENYHPHTQTWNSGNEEKIRYIVNNADKIKFIHIQGGEPFICPDVFDLMDAMLEKDLTNITMMAHTNGSITKSYKGKDLVNEYLAHWGQKAKINLSIDGLYQRGEYIRYGFKNDIWKQTFDKIAASDVTLGTDSRINIFNLLHLREWGEYLKEIMPITKGGKQWSKIGLWFNDTTNIGLIKVHEPSRRAAIEMIEGMIKDKAFPTEWERNIGNYIKWLENHHMPKQAHVQALLKGIEAFDQKRKINFDDTFPELREWKTAAKEYAN